MSKSGGSSSWLDEKKDELEAFAVDIVYDRHEGWRSKLLAGFLKQLSRIFSFVVQARYFLYEKRIFRDNALGCLVVVVGNLTVGGTGKTPVVERFARTLKERGRKVVILSRGYKSKKESIYSKVWRWLTHQEAAPPKVVSDGEKILMGSDLAGDEPYMLAKNLPGVPVLVDPNRVKSGEYAIKHFGADTLILDDGFQYLPLRGRMNLLLIDSTNPFGNGHLLPRGILREPIKHIKRASYVFLTKSQGRPDPKLIELIKSHKPDVEIIECKHEPQFLNQVNGEDRKPLDFLNGLKVAAFSGIASPESFKEFLVDLGAEVVFFKHFLDHHRFTSDELGELYQSANTSGAEIIVTTEKDAVRIEKEGDVGLPFYYLRLEIRILQGVKDFDSAVDRICFPKTEINATKRF